MGIVVDLAKQAYDRCANAIEHAIEMSTAFHPGLQPTIMASVTRQLLNDFSFLVGDKRESEVRALLLTHGIVIDESNIEFTLASLRDHPRYPEISPLLRQFHDETLVFTGLLLALGDGAAAQIAFIKLYGHAYDTHACFMKTTKDRGA